MIIQKDGNLFGLGETFHLRKVDGGLRVNRTTIPADDPDDAYEKVKAAAAKGQTYVDLDPKPAPAKKASPKKASPKQETETPESTA